MGLKLIENLPGDPRVPWTISAFGSFTVIFPLDSPLLQQDSPLTAPILPVRVWLRMHADGRYRLSRMSTSASVPAIVFEDYETAFAFKMRWDGTDV